jgi:hypothetical protein
MKFAKDVKEKMCVVLWNDQKINDVKQKVLQDNDVV